MNKSKQQLKRTVLGGLLFLFTTTAMALPTVTGTIGMTGGLRALDSDGNTINYATNAARIDFDFFSYDMFRAVTGDGDFAGLPPQLGNITDFQFDPLAGPITNFWTVGDFSFELTSVTRDILNDPAKFLILRGEGIVSAAGFEDSPVEWSLSANTSGGGIFSWSATFTVQEVATEPDMIILMSVDTSTPGTLIVTGASGSVDANANVAITNAATSETVTTTADSTGGFALNINGNSGDILNSKVTEVDGDKHTGFPYKVGAIMFISPLKNTLINDNEVNALGIYFGNQNASITVNRKPVCMMGNAFFVNNIPLESGTNTLTATLMTADGISSSAQINIDGSDSDILHIETENGGCILDGNTTVTFNTALDDAFAHSSYDHSGDGVIDYVTRKIQNFTTDFENNDVIDESTQIYISSIIEHDYNTANVYVAEFELTDDLGEIYTQQQYVIVPGSNSLNTVFENIWQDMNTALLNGDRDQALTYISSNAHHLYGAIFDALMPHMAEIQEDYSAIKPLSYGTNTADFAILKTVDGNVTTHIINFKRDGNGIWKLDSM